MPVDREELPQNGEEEGHDKLGYGYANGGVCDVARDEGGSPRSTGSSSMNEKPSSSRGKQNRLLPANLGTAAYIQRLLFRVPRKGYRGKEKRTYLFFEKRYIQYPAHNSLRKR